MSQAGAAASRRTKVERAFAENAREVAAKVAAQFQPVYDRICGERDNAIARVLLLQTALEQVAGGLPDYTGSPEQYARETLEQSGLTRDVAAGDGG
jgi:hypothetical protein